MTPTDIAWAAGLFEGEGCIAQSIEGFWGLQLLMTDEDVVRRFATIVGTGTIVSRKPRPENHQVVHVWRARQGKEVERLLVLLLPYLGERRKAVAERALRETRERARRVCGTCGTPFFANSLQKKFCSRKCMTAAIRKRNAAWRRAHPEKMKEYQRRHREKQARSAQPQA